MNGWDFKAREAFNELTDALEHCRQYLSDAYWNLPAHDREYHGDTLQEEIKSIDSAINTLNSVNHKMEDAGIA